ncbi:hypothetical protein FA743_11450 [Paracoccus gahaiensis]|uniref:Uncharacterized protein n=2 Tax=Paracoccus gahaiensis TaxID=1706839 RepID=A0A4U0R8T7_9RHOB|nr:hypothetical protein FA743_11450 [Paracoccus gahaiensis]
MPKIIYALHSNKKLWLIDQMLSLADPQPWLAAQAAQASALADAARDLGRLEATLLALPAAEAAGARERLVHLEVEAMLRAQGLMLGRDEIGREPMEARAASDPEALRLARWAVRRLEGQGALADLPSFLGLHRRAALDEPSATSMDLRLQGREFDGAAAEFLAAVDAFTRLHPLARGPAALALWRVASCLHRGRWPSLPSGRRAIWRQGPKGCASSPSAGMGGGSEAAMVRPRIGSPRILPRCAPVRRRRGR